MYEPEYRCPECEAKIEENDKYCSVCKIELDWTGEDKEEEVEEEMMDRERKIVVPYNEALRRWEIDHIIITLETFRRMLNVGNKEFDSMWALYSFYFMKARDQATNQPLASDKYCYGKLNWGSEKFYKYKKLLVKHNFIEQICKINKDNEYDYYIRIVGMPRSILSKKKVNNVKTEVDY